MLWLNCKEDLQELRQTEKKKIEKLSLTEKDQEIEFGETGNRGEHSDLAVAGTM